MKRKHALKGILFIFPSFAGVCVFWLLPYVDVIRRSFFGAVNGVFTGFMNYQMIFSNQAFLLAGKNTLRFFGICIPLLVVLSLATAVLLNGLGENQKQLMKTAFLLPMAIPVASVAIIWKVLFNGQGLLNHFLEMLSLKSWQAFPQSRNLFMRQQRWMEQVPGNALPELPGPIFCPLFLPL